MGADWPPGPIISGLTLSVTHFDFLDPLFFLKRRRKINRCHSRSCQWTNTPYPTPQPPLSLGMSPGCSWGHNHKVSIQHRLHLHIPATSWCTRRCHLRSCAARGSWSLLRCLRLIRRPSLLFPSWPAQLSSPVPLAPEKGCLASQGQLSRLPDTM